MYQFTETKISQNILNKYHRVGGTNYLTNITKYVPQNILNKYHKVYMPQNILNKYHKILDFTFIFSLFVFVSQSGPYFVIWTGALGRNVI